MPSNNQTDPPSMANLISQTYEDSFAITGASSDIPTDEPTREMAFRAQLILNLLVYHARQPEKTDLSWDFGPLTVNAVEELLTMVKAQTSQTQTETQTEAPPSTLPLPLPSTPSEPLARAIELGQEVHAINSAMNQGKVAFSNQKLQTRGLGDYYDSFFFNTLNKRREEIRAELLRLFR